MKWRNGLIGPMIVVFLLFNAGTGYGEPPETSEEGFSGEGVLSAQVSSEEDFSGLTPEQKRERIRKRIELLRMLRMAEELDLNEETSARVFSRLRPIHRKFWDLVEERGRYQRELQEATRSGKTDEKRLQELMKSIRENRKAMLDLEQEEMKALNGLLTTRQKAEYLIFRERFGQEVRERLEKARKGREQPPRPGLRRPQRPPRPEVRPP